MSNSRAKDRSRHERRLNRLAIRVSQSWLFYETASDREGIPVSPRGMRDSRFGIGFEFSP